MADRLKKGLHTGGGQYLLYIPPVELVCKTLRIKAIPLGKDNITVSAQGLREILALVLRNVEVDDKWYEQNYLDVVGAIMSGDVASCSEHFIHSGYFEGRQPSMPPYNENWYLSRYPDVAQACDNGTVANAKAHFMESGRQEGRAGIPEHGVESDKWIELTTTTE